MAAGQSVPLRKPCWEGEEGGTVWALGTVTYPPTWPSALEGIAVFELEHVLMLFVM